MDLNSKVNIISLAFAAKLAFSILPIGISIEEIDGFALKMYGLVIAKFSISDKLSKTRFFEDTLSLAYTTMEIVLKKLLLVLNNVDIQFDAECFTWRSNDTVKALPIAK